MRIHAGRGTNGEPEITLSEVYSGVGIETDMGLFGIAERDGGIEVRFGGRTVWTSHDMLVRARSRPSPAVEQPLPPVHFLDELPNLPDEELVHVGSVRKCIEEAIRRERVRGKHEPPPHFDVGDTVWCPVDETVSARVIAAGPDYVVVQVQPLSYRYEGADLHRLSKSKRKADG